MSSRVGGLDSVRSGRRLATLLGERFELLCDHEQPRLLPTCTLRFVL